MTKNILKIFPLEFGRKFTEREIKKIRKALFEDFSDSIVPESFRIQDFSGIQFIDCGINLKRVFCPDCNKVIDMDTWRELFKNAFAEGYDPEIDCELPCGHKFPLHALRYKQKCGFASSVISVEIVSHIFMAWLSEFPWLDDLEAVYENN